jgi:antitoxin PrlF
MGYDSAPVKVAANGRISIPARQRKALGLEDGGMVVMAVENGELRIRPVKAVLEDVRAMIAPFLRSSGDTVDQFLADRRAEEDMDDPPAAGDAGAARG